MAGGGYQHPGHAAGGVNAACHQHRHGTGKFVGQLGEGMQAYEKHCYAGGASLCLNGTKRRARRTQCKPQAAAQEGRAVMCRAVRVVAARHAPAFLRKGAV